MVNTSNSRTLNGVYGAPDTGGAPLQINGSGFEQTVGPIGFVDNITGFSLGTQYTYTVEQRQPDHHRVRGPEPGPG